MNPDMASTTASYWCYRCTRFARLSNPHDHIACPHCGSGFIEEIHNSPSISSNSPFPSGPISMFAYNSRRQGFRRRRRNAAGSRSPFNPVIVLRGGHADGGGDSTDDGGDHGGGSRFELYYDDGDGSGLRPLPPAVSEFLLGSGFDRLLEQFAQIEANVLGRPENPPASKSAIESMPTIQISEDHVTADSHCAVCTEAFELGSEAREMPCKHIYHSDCIVPWLSIRNSCPVCRDELPSDQNPNENRQIDEETLGLTIWRLPGGGFAVGRFPAAAGGGGGPGESHLPVVYTEMDGGLNVNEAPRRISRAMRSIRGSERSRGFGRMFRNVLSFFGRLGSRSTSSSLSSSYSSSEQEGSMGRTLGQLSSVFSRRPSTNWVLED